MRAGRKENTYVFHIRLPQHGAPRAEKLLVARRGRDAAGEPPRRDEQQLHPIISLTVNGDDLTQYYPEALRHALRVFLPVSGIISLAQFVIGGSVSIGHNRFCLKLVDGEQARFEDLFSGFDIFGNAFVLNLLITLKVLAWSLLFVIPGIVAAYRYSMATYILTENPNMQATEAIERSKALMDGRKGDLFRLDLSFIGWALLAVLTAGIGNL